MASAGFCQLNAPNNESADECFLLSGVSPISITKTATNIVFSEVTLHEPLGLFRSVALAWTEGLNAWASYLWLGFQAMVVPVGISSLGRIMNAVDSAIDPFLGSAVFGGLSRFGACVVQKLETANLLDSVSIVKPCCTSRKAETINSPLSAKDTWLLLASSHRALFGS